MNPFKLLRNQKPLVDQKAGHANALDRLTKATAIAISRRNFLKGLLASTAASIGIQLFSILPVAALECNTCLGPCANCNSLISSCCSPNGQFCWTLNCVCPQGCGPCGVFRAIIRACNDGSVGNSCPLCP